MGEGAQHVLRGEKEVLSKALEERIMEPCDVKAEGGLCEERDRPEQARGHGRGQWEWNK